MIQLPSSFSVSSQSLMGFLPIFLKAVSYSSPNYTYIVFEIEI